MPPWDTAYRNLACRVYAHNGQLGSVIVSVPNHSGGVELSPRRKASKVLILEPIEKQRTELVRLFEIPGCSPELVSVRRRVGRYSKNVPASLSELKDQFLASQFRLWELPYCAFYFSLTFFQPPLGRMPCRCLLFLRAENKCPAGPLCDNRPRPRRKCPLRYRSIMVANRAPQAFTCILFLVQAARPRVRLGRPPDYGSSFHNASEHPAFDSLRLPRIRQQICRRLASSGRNRFGVRQ